MQDYPREKIEIIIVDGGSKDKTIEIARKYKVDQILHNSLTVEEFGRALGIEASKNDIIAFIDQDNILDSSDWLKKMIKPFREDEVGGSEPLFYSCRRRDPAIVRYCSLIGADDPLYIYLGYYDRFCHFKGKWTETPVKERDEGDYLHVKLLSNREIPTMGANGFMVRKELLKKIRYKPFIHTDIIYQLVKLGHQDFAKVKVGLIHLHARGITDFLKKKLRRIRRYSMVRREYNVDFKRKIPKFILYTLLLLPISSNAIEGYRRKPDNAWFLHLLICPLILLTYGVEATGILMKKMNKVSHERG
jgi:glycosyltransferase involved in cell wall biosynthesis